MKRQKFDGSPTPRSRIVALGAASVGLLALAGCNESAPVDPGATGASKAYLTSFTTCEEVDTYLSDVVSEAAARAWAYNYGYRDVVGGDFGAPTSTPDAAEGGAGDGDTPPAAPEEYTDTNVQEEGVDEPDLVKTNGQHMFVVNGETLHILDAWPAEEAHEVATFPLPGWGENMFLAGDRVVVFSSIWTGEHPSTGGGEEPGRSEPGFDGGAEPDEALPPEGEVPTPDPDPLDDGVWFSGTRVTVIDVSDPAAPTEAAVFDVEGSFTNARMVDGTVYFVSNSDLFAYYDPALTALIEDLDLPTVDWDASEEERAAAEATILAQIRPLVKAYMADGGRDRVIPDIRTTDSDRRNALDCADMMYPSAHAGTAILSVFAFDPAAPAVEGVGLVANGWQVYGSLESLYVAQDSRWWFWPELDDAEAMTHIHKFSLNDGLPAYEASGEVAGWLLNQFSMSEFDGHLRVATTDSSWFGGGGIAVDVAGPVADGGTTDSGGDSVDVEVDAGSSDPEPTPSATPKSVVDLREDTSVDANNVFVLEQQGRNLEVVGGIRGIAPTERIYAVRFIGDTGYVVTFRQTDPLFVVDLTDPTAPALRGELHVPGYSGYLHPFGDDHLIGIGRDGDETGVIRGLQLSVFDVSNPDDPTRSAIHTLPYGDGSYSWSEAEHDHHAFTFFASRGLLAIPVTLEDYGWEDDTYSHFSGIVVFHVTPTAITEVGRVSHTMMARDRYCGDIDTSDPEPVEACSSWDYPWWVQVRRSVFMDDYLFAISNQGVTSSAIEALDEVLAEVRFF
jgi:uncharacterized secreted protein with C-terminal beta-propeller domain